ncbi:MAG: CDP-diacylglycerol--glycerol-3-phosphate 3-phosphatidyltransferase [Candidatus Enterosoma sp.]|nr:CDP-diacylglycerol--glycerol-3-phosphate 3-phosphatidyltransferase [Bacilli bacterium]MDD7181255.1 CDP-diacylglycerol--glycerol-3-phosphate 3-phosphatidyltransferase [Bacilli bacterium]MDY3046780.1 CDP-diacylglycerol--glycerol-3-phosphate 3-phosphatidyltransferase [Candidatus Enterosoma sp.]
MSTPNKITSIRLALAFVVIIVFSLSFIPASATFAPEIVIGQLHMGFNWIDIVCCILFIIASITDAIDGHIARSRNLVTDFGKFLDPFADKFLVDSSLLLLCVRLDWSGHYQVMPFLIALFIGRDLAMDGLRMVAAGKGTILAANIWGKVKTAVQMGLIPVLFLNGFPFSLIPNELNLNSWLTTRFQYTYILTNIFVLITLFFSLLSLGIYLYKNKAVLKGSK